MLDVYKYTKGSMVCVPQDLFDSGAGTVHVNTLNFDEDDEASMRRREVVGFRRVGEV